MSILGAAHRRNVPTGSGYSAAVMADTPWLYWRLSETSGTSIADSSGNSRNGTISGGYTLNQSSALSNESGNPSLTIGTAGMVTGPNSLDVSASDYSLEFWVKLNGSFSAWVGLCSKGGASNDLSVQRYNTTGNLGIFHGSTSITLSGQFTALVDNTWKHVVVTYKNSTKAVKLYVNGSLADSRTHTVNPGYNSTYDVRLGASRDPITCPGGYDEFAIYTSELSSTRVLAHYNASL